MWIIKKMRLSLSTWIFISIALGVVAGLLLGDQCTKLYVIGKMYIMLLQMTVLPYIMISLIYGIGSLSFQEAKTIALKGGMLLLFLWIIVSFVIFILAYSFPVSKSASLYSVSNLEQSTVDYLGIYIPENLFSSLSNNSIPAVVLFSVCIGIALIGMQKKNELINILKIIGDSLITVSKWMIYLTPIGTFALTANTAGTIDFSQLGRIQIYCFAFIVGCSILAVYTCPLMISCFSSIKYKDLYKSFKGILLLVFTTGSIFIVLPLMIEKIKELLERYREQKNNEYVLVNCIIPISYNFPTMGSLFPMFFILFAGWFYNKQFLVGEKLNLVFSSVTSLFGSASNAIPFLLNQMKLPADAYGLYILTTTITYRFKTLLEAISMSTLSIVCITISLNFGKIKIKKCLLMLLNTFFMVALSAFIINHFSDYLLSKISHPDQTIMNMEIRNPVPSKVYLKRSEEVCKIELFDRIKEDKVLRVGYNANSLPFAFFNKKGDLVGYDIAFAHELARSLGCSLEFIPFDYSSIVADLENNVFDVAMSAVSIVNTWQNRIFFTSSYMTLQVAFVVEDYKREEFHKQEDIRDIEGLKIAVLAGSSYISTLRECFPNATIIEYENRKQFFEKHEADALLTTAEQGIAWSLLYPSYTVIIPEPSMRSDILGYPVSKTNTDFLLYLNQWLDILKTQNFNEQQYSYWILGKNSNRKH